MVKGLGMEGTERAPQGMVTGMGTRATTQRPVPTLLVVVQREMEVVLVVDGVMAA